MEERPNQRSAFARYWPVLIVAVVLAAVVAIGALSGGDDDGDDDGDEVAADTTQATDEDGDDGEGDGGDGDEGDDDAMSAPDCDPETGRIMVPTLLAPNCVPLWDDTADNGGATHNGVTADSITVVVYIGPDTE